MSDQEIKYLIRQVYDNISRGHDEIEALLDKMGAPRREPCKVVRLTPGK